MMTATGKPPRSTTTYSPSRLTSLTRFPNEARAWVRGTWRMTGLVCLGMARPPAPESNRTRLYSHVRCPATGGRRLRRRIALVEHARLAAEELDGVEAFDGAVALEPGLGALAAAGAAPGGDVAAVALAALQETLVAGGADAAAILPLLGEARLDRLGLAAEGRA